jgi:hypothetical protein
VKVPRVAFEDSESGADSDARRRYVSLYGGNVHELEVGVHDLLCAEESEWYDLSVVMTPAAAGMTCDEQGLKFEVEEDMCGSVSTP